MQLLSCDLWLMEPNAMRQFAALAAANVSANIEQVRASARATERQKSVAVIPVTGVLEARTTLMGELLGMTSYERIGYVFDAMMNDETVSGIILDVASPGGMVYGAQELADKIFQARGRKPIVAVANPMAASGAYWLAAAADRVVVTPSGDVGSVGVIAEHVDMSQAYDREGAKVTIIRSQKAPFKGETNDANPLTDEARQNMQARADAIHSKFVADLARFRGVSVDYVNENFGKGRIVDAKSAMAAGMVDRVGTLQEIIGKMAAGRLRISGERAQDNWDAPTRREELQMKAQQIREIAAKEPVTETVEQ